MSTEPNNLEQELIAPGFTPVPIPVEGVIAWTGWHAPQEKDTYETYYDLVTDAMYPQPWDRHHPHNQQRVGGRCTALPCWVKEYRAVVD